MHNNTMEIEAFDQWSRKEHFSFFSQMDHPQYDLSFRLNLGNLYHYVKEQQLSFYYALLYFSTQAANSVEAFRYRIRTNMGQGDLDSKMGLEKRITGGPVDIVLHKKIHPSYTDRKKDEEFFKYIMIEAGDSIFEFDKEARYRVETQQEFLPEAASGIRDDLIYATCIPWIDYNQFNHAFTTNKYDAIPRLAWGKFINEQGKISTTFSVQVHHCFVDGLHIAQFKTALETILESL